MTLDKLFFQSSLLPLTSKSDHDEISEDAIRLERLALFNKLKNLNNIFSENYLRAIAQAKYNFEYCEQRPQEVEKEICDQAAALLRKHEENINALDLVVAEIKTSNIKLKESTLLETDPILNLMIPRTTIPRFEDTLERHFGFLKSFTKTSIETFKQEFTEENKPKIFNLHALALGHLQRSPLSIEKQESLNRRLIERSEQLIDKSISRPLLSDEEKQGSISELAVKLRKKFFQRQDIEGISTENSQPAHPTLNLERETIGGQYLKDEEIERI